MSRRLFVAGCWILIALGIVHLLGHVSLVTSTGESETQRRLLALMRDFRQDMGAGFVRSTMDILSGFSLALSVLSIGWGLLGLVIARHASQAPGLLRSAAAASAGVWAAMVAIGLRYWFLAPLAFLVPAFLCFLVARAAAPRSAGAGGVGS